MESFFAPVVKEKVGFSKNDDEFRIVVEKLRVLFLFCFFFLVKTENVLITLLGTPCRS